MRSNSIYNGIEIFKVSYIAASNLCTGCFPARLHALQYLFIFLGFSVVASGCSLRLSALASIAGLRQHSCSSAQRSQPIPAQRACARHGSSTSLSVTSFFFSSRLMLERRNTQPGFTSGCATYTLNLRPPAACLA